MRSHHSDGDLTVVRSISRIHCPGSDVEENVATAAGLQVCFESAHCSGPPSPEVDGGDGRFRGHVGLPDRGQRSADRPEFATAPAGCGVNRVVPIHSTSCFCHISQADRGSGHLLPALGRSERIGVVGAPMDGPQWAMDLIHIPLRSGVGQSRNQSPSPRLRRHLVSIPEDQEWQTPGMMTSMHLMPSTSSSRVMANPP